MASHPNPESDVLPDCAELLAAVEDDPGRCFPTLHLEAVAYIGPDGKPGFSYHIRGERYLSNTLALLRMIEVALVRDAYGDDEEEG